MMCTATTRLAAEQCLERLAACPALPRGERLALFAEESHGRLFGERTWHIKLVLGETVAQEVALGIGKRACFCVHPRWFRDWAAPVRRLREERRALKARLAALREASLNLYGNSKASQVVREALAESLRASLDRETALESKVAALRADNDALRAEALEAHAKAANMHAEIESRCPECGCAPWCTACGANP